MHNGFAIAIAWPETFCKQAGSWYDGIMNFLRISQNNYYKVGHAAIVLVNEDNGLCYYFDFGRYHAPFGSGRVRDQITDHDLEMETIARITDGHFDNFEEILDELKNNPACHGSGSICAEYCALDFKKALVKAKSLQVNSPLRYGPFIWKGSNCSRFVRTIILSGYPSFFNYLLLFFPLTLTPTPIGNVRALKFFKQIQNIIIRKDKGIAKMGSECQTAVN
jgi:hypothetical protein